MGNLCYKESSLIENSKIHSRLSDSINNQLNRITIKKSKTGIDKKQHLDVLKSYQIIKPIGRGLYSKVFLARDASKIKVAIKVIPKDEFQNKEDLKNILIEKEILKLLENEHILKLYRTLQTDSKIIFVLEYAGKGNLVNLMNIKTHLRIEEIKVIAAQIFEGLLYMHSKGIIYGDLKAENVLMTNLGIIKLCDFNFSGTSSLLSTALQGTVNYLSPELITGHTKTSKSDIWALGILLHLLFYKRFPFQGEHQAELFFNVVNRPVDKETFDKKAPEEFRFLITNLLEKTPKRRIGNSLDEIKKHPFFYGFDWENYKSSEFLRSFVRGIPSLDSDVSQSFNENEGLMSPEKEIEPTNIVQLEQKNLNIDGFTYEDYLYVNQENETKVYQMTNSNNEISFDSQTPDKIESDNTEGPV